jgi:hypothetical protein
MMDDAHKNNDNDRTRNENVCWSWKYSVIETEFVFSKERIKLLRDFIKKGGGAQRKRCHHHKQPNEKHVCNRIASKAIFFEALERRLL